MSRVSDNQKAQLGDYWGNFVRNISYLRRCTLQLIEMQINFKEKIKM